jgi:hypothetical protein
MFDSSRQIHSYVTTGLIICSSTGVMMHSPIISLLHQESSEVVPPPPGLSSERWHGCFQLSPTSGAAGVTTIWNTNSKLPHIYEIVEKSPQ